MSIWGSWDAPDDGEHLDSCARWDKKGDTWDISDRPCDCGQPDAPLVYEHSGVMPDEGGTRGGSVDIASVAKDIQFWRDNPTAPIAEEPEGWEPFLRFGVNEGTVVLTLRNVRQVHATLTEWLAQFDEGSEP